MGENPLTLLFRRYAGRKKTAMSENKKNPIDYNAAIDVRARGQSSYRIFPSDSFDDLSRCMEELGSKDLRVCVVTDSNVEKLYLDDVKNVLEGSCARLTSFTIPAGEQHKTLDEIRRLYTHLIGQEFDRRDLLVALGGGVTGDMTGFAAATYLRGIRFVQIPTTLLSQVDSSIGGKTGVDFDSYKNMVGAFHQPSMVYLNVNTLQTLDETTAGNRGAFRFRVSLEKEGETELIVHAHADGLIDASVRGWVTFNSKTLPVSGIDENMTTSQDQVVISGTTLAGTQLQLISPFGLSKKRAQNDGSFSFELNTKEEGSYDYTLLLEKSGYVQRRFTFTVVRIKTDDQQRDEIRKTAVRIKYKDLQKGLERDLGKVLNVYGPVSEISSAGDITYIRMQFSKNAGGKWINPVVLTCESDPGLQAGNYISAVVAVDGVYTEQDGAGNDVSVPRLKLLFIDRIE